MVAAAQIEPPLLTTKQAAEAMSIPSRKLWTMTTGGEIPDVRIGRADR